MRGLPPATALPGAGLATSRQGAWTLWADAPLAPDGGERGWLGAVARLIATCAPVHRSKHAATYHWPRPDGDVYVKVYRRYRTLTTVKDCLRGSKARHVVRMHERLAGEGFRVPQVLAAAEERPLLCTRQAWVATAALAGEPLAARLATLAGARGMAVGEQGQRAVLREKRSLLEAVGCETARLHQAGFVAGDLVPANVWVAGGGERPQIVLLDHDRTRWGRTGAWWWRARRNLVQLNRFVLKGVGATDRLRVFRAYAKARRWSAAEARRRLQWIIAKTIERRRRFDGVVVPPGMAIDLRVLMRDAGPFDCQSRVAGGRRSSGGRGGMVVGGSGCSE